MKENFYKSDRYYVASYVVQVPNWMTKKQAKEQASFFDSPIFKTWSSAEDWRVKENLEKSNKLKEKKSNISIKIAC